LEDTYKLRVLMKHLGIDGNLNFEHHYFSKDNKKFHEDNREIVEGTLKCTQITHFNW
jgi:hypothetical protein